MAQGREGRQYRCMTVLVTLWVIEAHSLVGETQENNVKLMPLSFHTEG